MKKIKITYRRFQCFVIIVALILSFLFVFNVPIVKPLTNSLTLTNKTTTTAKKKTTKSNEPSYKVSFNAVGDNLIHNTINTYADGLDGKTDRKYNYNSIYEPVRNDINNADLSFINQETIMGGKAASGYPRFNTPDDMMKSLEYLGVDVVNGATNHALDQGTSGIEHQIQLFKNMNKMTLIGLYDSQEAYDKITYVTKNGLTFAFLAYTYGSNVAAGNSYSIKQFDEALITKEVTEAKQNADFIVVSAHWGTEYDSNTNVIQDTHAQTFANLGVDLVIGTHPHVIQEMKWITNNEGHRTLIAFSLGNFVSTQLTADRLLGGMLSCDFSKANDTKTISNVKWTPIVTHIEASNINSQAISGITNMKVYKLKEYTSELSSKHILNRSSTTLTKEILQRHTSNIIKDFTIDV